MLRTRYLGRENAAMPVSTCLRHVVGLAMLLSLLLFAGCQPKKPVTEVPTKDIQAQGLERLLSAPEINIEIQALMARAQAGADIEVIMAAFDRLIANSPPLLRDEASFRKVQLMLEMQHPDAVHAAETLITGYPDYALIPNAHFWLAKWWLLQDEAGRALVEMRKALLNVQLSRELADEILALGPVVMQKGPEWESVRWLLAAAQVDTGGRDSWMRIASRKATLVTMERLHADGTLEPVLMPEFDLHVGRAYLMRGDTAAVDRIAQLLEAALPDSPELKQLQTWASGKIQAATIGVLLPLTGSYAQHGRDALRGIRIALAGLEFNHVITLRVEDTASDAATAIAAYKRLADESVNMIIGPLLADTTEALLPHLEPDLPVISLSGSTDLASQSEVLFIHTLSPLAQVYMMANYAWQQGARRMVVISGDGGSDMVGETEQFIAAFESLGGEVLQALYLDSNTLDHRVELRQLRYDTDDEELLVELDEDQALLMPEMDLEINMPVNFDALYLVLNGKQVSLLAGQLAYADISGMPVYGSRRWQDGHLLDDRGRYLSNARFAASNVATADDNMDDPARSQLFFAHRETWGSGKPSELIMLAYDTMQIATVLTSRLALDRGDIVSQLQDSKGFPALTGHVRFDASGVGQKQLDIFSIRKGKINDLHDGCERSECPSLCFC
jgi:ABC-type branched-subunit amino acid transport system substrate-binding protein